MGYEGRWCRVPSGAAVAPAADGVLDELLGLGHGDVLYRGDTEMFFILGEILHELADVDLSVTVLVHLLDQPVPVAVLEEDVKGLEQRAQGLRRHARLGAAAAPPRLVLEGRVQLLPLLPDLG